MWSKRIIHSRRFWRESSGWFDKRDAWSTFRCPDGRSERRRRQEAIICESKSHRKVDFRRGAIWHLRQKSSWRYASLQDVIHAQLIAKVSSDDTRIADICQLIECSQALSSVAFRPVHNLKQIQLPNNVENSRQYRWERKTANSKSCGLSKSTRSLKIYDFFAWFWFDHISVNNNQSTSSMIRGTVCSIWIYFLTITCPIITFWHLNLSRNKIFHHITIHLKHHSLSQLHIWNRLTLPHYYNRNCLQYLTLSSDLA